MPTSSSSSRVQRSWSTEPTTCCWRRAASMRSCTGSRRQGIRRRPSSKRFWRVRVFIWDLYQSSRINQLDVKVDRLMDAEAKVEAARRVEVDLDENVNRLALI